jgi:hypothetical protein
MFRLPVSKIEVELHDATGAEDMLLLEGARGVVETSIALAGRVARRCDGEDLDAAALPITDIEALLLELRRRLFGELVESRGRCPVEECGTPTDLSFRISEYVAHHLARMPGSRMPGTRKPNAETPANVEPVMDDPPWFQIRGSGVQFRLVTAGDVAAAAESRDPEGELARRTIRSRSAEERKRAGKPAQRAMQALAPPLSGEIEGTCPECGATARFWFDAQSYVQRELRYEAEFLYEDVHLLAGRYHWTEEKILSLPRARRARYVEMALRGDRGD